MLSNRLPQRVSARSTCATRSPTEFELATPTAGERLGAAYVFAVDIPASDKAALTIEEATPLYRTADIRAPGGMELVTAYLSSAALEGPLKDSVAKLLELQKGIGNLEQQIATARDAMAEYRLRMDELHAQVVTLRAVRTAGPLVASLERKLAEVSDRISKSTLQLVALQREAHGLADPIPGRRRRSLPGEEAGGVAQRRRQRTASLRGVESKASTLRRGP